MTSNIGSQAIQRITDEGVVRRISPKAVLEVLQTRLLPSS